jgi:hypothetical protein
MGASKTLAGVSRGSGPPTFQEPGSALHRVLYRFTKWAFPRTPRMVRERQLRAVCLMVFLVALCCALTAVVLWVANHSRGP